MLKIQLRDIALLRSSLEMKFGAEDGDPQPPDRQLLELAVEVVPEPGEFTCFIEGKLEDESLPFDLSFEMGFLYEVPAEPMPKVDEIQPTLVWLAYPYMRELVANLTGRSPAGQYFLPPLTRLPQPDETTDE